MTKPSLFKERLGELNLITGNYPAALEAFQSAYEERRLTGALSAADQARHFLWVASLALKIGRYEEALDRCRQGILLAQAKDPALTASLEALAGLVRCSVGDFNDASAYVERGFARLALGNDTDPEVIRAAASLHRVRGNLLMGLGQPEKAVASFEESLRRWRRVEDKWEQSIALFNLGEAHAHAGHTTTALRFLDEAQQAKSAINDHWGLAYTHLARAQIFLVEKETDRALTEATTGLEKAQDVGDPKIIGQLRILRGEIYVANNQNAEAERELRELLEGAGKATTAPELVRAKLVLATVRRRQGQGKEAERLAQQAYDLAVKSRARELMAAAALELGRDKAAGGDLEQAKRLLHQAQELADEIGNPYRSMEVVKALARLEPH